MTEDNLRETKRLMGALGRMPPKPHSDMKIGKISGKAKDSKKSRSVVKAKGK